LAWIQHPTVKRIVAARIAAHSSQNWRGIPAFIEDIDDEASRVLITRAVAGDFQKQPGDGTKLRRNIVDTVNQLRLDHLDRQSTALRARLNAPGLSQEDSETILRELTGLRAKRE